MLGACSVNQIVAKSSTGLIDAGVRSMNQETDLTLAGAAIPANLKLIESLIVELPRDRHLQSTAAQAFYGYAFGFVEDTSPERAALLYKRGLDHALAALAVDGVRVNLLEASPEAVTHDIARLDRTAVPELFWAASNWAKWIDLTRNDPAHIADVPKAVSLMQRVLELEPGYYFGGPALFFGVYYGNRTPMLGGDFVKSAQYFDQAAAYTQGQWLLNDVLRAQYLAQQMDDRAAFHQRLSAVLAAPDSPPDMALANAIARAKARRLLAREDDLF
jgi:hypothetical protein